MFDWLAEHGNIEPDEMRRTFNCGVGMVAVVAANVLNDAIQILRDHGEDAWPIGRIVSADAGHPGAVQYV